MTEPTYAELIAAWKIEAEKNLNRSNDIRVGYARAVLARWGQPAQAAEPVAWLYTTPMPDGSTFVGASSERLQIGIGVTPGTIEQPLFTAPQPVEREPLSDEQIEVLPIWKRFVGLWPETRREIVRTIERHHGIKGGQHGNE